MSDGPDDPRRPARDDDVDEAAKESFPASDPPGWSPLHVGAPGDHPDSRGAGDRSGDPGPKDAR